MIYSHRHKQYSRPHTQKHQKAGGSKKKSSTDTVPGIKSTFLNSKKTISKKKYLQWESHIVENCRQIVPKNGRPTIARRNKIIVVADMVPQGSTLPMSKLVRNGQLKSIPEKHRILLYHMNNKKLDTVSLGYEQHPQQPKQKVFKHPATDFGGLTNLTQIVGEEDVTFKNTKPYVVNTKTNVTSCAKQIYKTWLSLSKKKTFYQGNKVLKGLKKFIQSLVRFLQDNSSNITSAHIQFYSLPSEIRMVYTSKDIKKQTGSYYQRLYLGDEQKHGQKIKPSKNIFTTIAYSDNMKKPFITPNINMVNLMNEYTPMF